MDRRNNNEGKMGITMHSTCQSELSHLAAKNKTSFSFGIGEFYLKGDGLL